MRPLQPDFYEMNRPLRRRVGGLPKYRVWDHRAGQFGWFDLRSAFGRLPADIPDDQIQEFTGVTDSSGVEIYEGDILVRKNSAYVYTCEYSPEEAAYMLRDADGDMTIYLPDFAGNLTVVGNVFAPPAPSRVS